MKLISLLILAVAVSLDGLGVGITYGLRKIRVPALSLMTIGICSALVIFLSMELGQHLSSVISPSASKMCGAFILIGIGLWAIVNVIRQRQQEDAVEADNQTVGEIGSKEMLRIEIKTFGLIIQILKTPSAADMDRSGTILGKEAALLGIALSLDAFGAGLGAALVGLSPWLTPAIIALTSIAFVLMGLKIGTVFAHAKWLNRLYFLPGLLLVILGLSKIL